MPSITLNGRAYRIIEWTAATAVIVERKPGKWRLASEAMTGAWRVIIARVPGRYVTYYYHENDDARLRLALRAQAERWVASHLERRKR